MRVAKRVYTKSNRTVVHGMIARLSSPWPKKRSGVYFLIRGGQVMYVGQSSDVFARVAQHARTREFDHWHWFAYPPERLIERETHWMRRLAPLWNEYGRVYAERIGQDVCPVEFAAEVATEVATGNFAL